jgi:uncharacterized protein YegP (UPF0339 family)
VGGVSPSGNENQRPLLPLSRGEVKREGAEMSGKFVLKKSGDQFMFNLKAANGEIIATSERYEHKQGALNGIESVRTNAPTATVDDQT